MLSICVTVKNRFPLFRNSVESICASARQLNVPVELIVADWHSTDCSATWIKDECPGLDTTVITMPDEAFSRGRGLNAAAAAAKYTNLFFSDADMLLHPDIFWHAISAMEAGKAYFPICWAYATPERTGGRYRTGGKGIVALSKILYLTAGKWDEFTQWGSEDLRFFERVSQLAPIARPMEIQLKHQWHPTTILKGTPK